MIGVCGAGQGAFISEPFSPTRGPSDPSIPAESPLIYDASGTPGNFTAPSGSRILVGKFAGGTSRVVITHPEVTAAWKAEISYEGSNVLTPRSNRFLSVRCVNGAVEADMNTSSASAGDGPFIVTLKVRA